jgi:hypothetical protein
MRTACLGVAALFALSLCACSSSRATGSTGGAGGASGAAGSGGAGGTGGSDAGGAPPISLATFSAVETEPWIAAAPNGVVIASWIAIELTSASHVGYAVSRNGGQSFLPAARLDAPGGRDSSDPTVAADANSNFYAAWIGFLRDAEGNPTDIHVYVAKAAAGASSFGTPNDVSGADAADKPWLTVAPSGALILTWASLGSPAAMRFAVSHDGETHFTEHDIANGAPAGNLIFSCVDGVSGRIFVTYYAGASILLQSTDNDGASWSAPLTVSSSTDDAAMFDDPTCVAHNGKVWISYGIGTEAFSEDVNPRSLHLRLVTSNDAGQSIATRAFVEDSSAGTLFLHPQLVRESSGALDLLYYAGNDQDPDPNGSLRLTRSADGGSSWSASEVVASPISFQDDRGAQIWLGDYMGFVALGTSVYGDYVDNTSGRSHVRFFSRSH